jgi:hypothetical protein
MEGWRCGMDCVAFVRKFCIYRGLRIRADWKGGPLGVQRRSLG